MTVAAAEAVARARLDLSVFDPARPCPEGRWRHAIRRLDDKSRVLVPELESFGRTHRSSIGASLSGRGWELAPTEHGGLGSVSADAHGRVRIPRGVCHRLGLAGAVVVSTAVGSDRIVVWSASALDELLEGRP